MERPGIIQEEHGHGLGQGCGGPGGHTMWQWISDDSDVLADSDDVTIADGDVMVDNDDATMMKMPPQHATRHHAHAH